MSGERRAGEIVALPDGAEGALSPELAVLAEKARAYALDAAAANTRRAYDADWRHYAGWCARRGAPPLPPDPRIIGLYLADLASEAKPGGVAARGAATVARRLSGLTWHFRRRGFAFDRGDRHVVDVLAGVRRRHAAPPFRKEALLADDLRRMLAVLGWDLRGLRDRALLLLGFAGGLRRSELVGLDCGRGETLDGAGWVEFCDGGLLLRVRGKTGWREVEVGLGSAPQTCPAAALKAWLAAAKAAHGPLFRPISRSGRVMPDRLSDRHVARLVKAAAEQAGLRGDLSETERLRRYSGHSLRAGLATAAEAEERLVQRHLGHASAEMTRRYQRRRERFRVNLTKAAGL